MKLWKRYERIHPKVLKATEDLIKMRPWRLSKKAQREVAWLWIVTASRVYGMDPPRVVIDGRMRSLLGYYQPHDHVIRLKKFSVVTLLHEFRHAMHHQLDLPRDDEEDAMAWSLSVFYQAAPRRFRKMLRAGRIQTLTEVHE